MKQTLRTTCSALVFAAMMHSSAFAQTYSNLVVESVTTTPNTASSNGYVMDATGEIKNANGMVVGHFNKTTGQITGVGGQTITNPQQAALLENAVKQALGLPTPNTLGSTATKEATNVLNATANTASKEVTSALGGAANVNVSGNGNAQIALPGVGTVRELGNGVTLTANGELFRNAQKIGQITSGGAITDAAGKALSASLGTEINGLLRAGGLLGGGTASSGTFHQANTYVAATDNGGIYYSGNNNMDLTGQLQKLGIAKLTQAAASAANVGTGNGLVVSISGYSMSPTGAIKSPNGAIVGYYNPATGQLTGVGGQPITNTQQAALLQSVAAQTLQTTTTTTPTTGATQTQPTAPNILHVSIGTGSGVGGRVAQN